MSKIRLSTAKDKRYRGIFNYLIAYDYSAGLPERYRVLVLNSDDPVTIGRELDLKTVRNLIADYEEEAAKLPCCIGSRKDVSLVKTRVTIKRIRGSYNEGK
jgi:hypothetical protein